MAGVAKWLRQWIVTPPVAGSNPVIRPFKKIKKTFWISAFCFDLSVQKTIVSVDCFTLCIMRNALDIMDYALCVFIF